MNPRRKKRCGAFATPTAAALSPPLLATDCRDFLNQEFRRLHSAETVNLCEDIEGKPMLMVSTARYCGFSRCSSRGSKALYQQYEDGGLVVLAFLEPKSGHLLQYVGGVL
jgi:glutathione peroxidase